MSSPDRRRAVCPCPPESSACWLAGGGCEQCIPEFALQAAETLEAELRNSMAPELSKLTARRQAIGLVRQFQQEQIYAGSDKRLKRRQRNEAIRQAYAAGVPAAVLAKRYRRSRSCIYAAIRESGERN